MPLRTFCVSLRRSMRADDHRPVRLEPFDWTASVRDFIREPAALLAAVVLVAIVAYLAVHGLGGGSSETPPHKQWRACANSVRDSVHELSVISGQPEGDVDAGVVAECGPEPS